MLPLAGYADRWSVAPTETIAFKISSTAKEPYQAQLMRVICGDPNPAGPGIKEQIIAADFAASYPSREQAVALGSYATIADSNTTLQNLASFTVAATIWPTTPAQGRQGIVAKFDPGDSTGFALTIDQEGVGAMLGHGEGQSSQVSVGKPLRERTWYRVWCIYDADLATLLVGQAPLRSAYGIDDAGVQTIGLDAEPMLDTSVPLLIAALPGSPVSNHYNGKIERPYLLSKASSEPIEVNTDALLALWDFSQDISSTHIRDIGPHALHGELINLPARAMTGSNWNGTEMCWRHAPEQYGAIHFHDDDIYDCSWQTDFSFTVPVDFKSGVYAVRLQCGDASEMIPFFVRPRLGQPQAKACVLIPTLTYTVYTNYARNVSNDQYRERVRDWGARPWTTDEHLDYGLSTYNFHNDGSGICYSSTLRPSLTMRSGFLAYVDPYGSGLRHFAADTHLLGWLETQGHDYDVITDHDLHAEGVELIARYKTVLTTTHPEYQTEQTLDALTAYTEQGGRLMYLGGDGFYWRVALHPDLPGAVEIRRGEGGIRAWAAEPGEYYHSFDGCYGGLWRRNGRPPQQLVGVGFTSQGPFEGSYYRRLADADDPRAAWIFDGVEDSILGDFGLSGGGAGGFELDRLDYRLGTPHHTLLLARSEAHDLEKFVLVHEDRLTDHLTWPGQPAAQLIHADMVYFETPHDGAVFSVGSITFCGSLAHNNYDNNISRILNNVIVRFCEA